MDENDYLIPRTLDNGALFFMWEADNAVLAMMWVILGGVLNMFLVGVLFAFLFTRGYASLKEEGGKGLIVRVIYWFSPSDMWLSKRLPSYLREYIG